MVDGLDLTADSGKGRSTNDESDIRIASGLTAAGAALFITGVVLLPVGAAKRHRARGNLAASWTPLVSVGPTGAQGAIRFAF